MLHHARKGHSCARIRRGKDNHNFSMIAVGGYSSYNNDYLSIVEILDDVKSRWRYGPELPIKVGNATLIEDPAGGVILIGGQSTTVEHHDHVYRLAHAGPDAKWIKMTQTLKTARHAHVGFLVPDEAFECSSSWSTSAWAASSSSLPLSAASWTFLIQNFYFLINCSDVHFKSQYCKIFCNLLKIEVKLWIITLDIFVQFHSFLFVPYCRTNFLSLAKANGLKSNNNFQQSLLVLVQK